MRNSERFRHSRLPIREAVGAAILVGAAALTWRFGLEVIGLQQYELRQESVLAQQYHAEPAVAKSEIDDLQRRTFEKGASALAKGAASGTLGMFGLFLALPRNRSENRG
jgi:hypothetical protein